VSLSIAALTRLPPELAHKTALGVASRLPSFALGALARANVVKDPCLEVEVFGLVFPTPLGLAAGYDKDGVATRALFAFGFGHVEVGTVTRRPQPGNDGERLFRVREEKGLVNRLGFPNAGVEALVRRLEIDRTKRPSGIVGVNVGKNKDVALEDAPAEYAALYAAVAHVADYVTINVSSPNTEGLRSLQSAQNVRVLLAAVGEARARSSAKPPVLLKISPDLTEADLDALVDEVLAADVAGIVATNTTLSREGVPAYAKDLQGGLSGRPLIARARSVLRDVARRVDGKVPIVSVGGIDSAEEALARIRAGATLVQLYTALVYEGPSLARDIAQGLRDVCKREGLKNVLELRGRDL
jgi:dihydroorotate dehydrogenase